MTAYVISDVTVFDPVVFKEYRDLVPAVLAHHKVEYVVRTEEIAVLEGDWHPSRVVALRFTDVEHVRRWYESPEYEELMAVRKDSARVNAIIVPGY